jgi:hypothetical protein
VIEASYESLEAVMAAIQSPERREMNEYVKSLGTLILMYEIAEAPLG